MVMFAVSSEFLCETAELGSSPGAAQQGPCTSDFNSINSQIVAAKHLQDTLDQEAGGAGLGWYRIVTTPGEAREVIKHGKLAVVLGIEAANAFGCRIERSGAIPSVKLVPSDSGSEATYRNNCSFGNITLNDLSGHATAEEFAGFGNQSTAKALALFERYWAMGVRHFFLTHNIDGIAGGTALHIDLLHGEINPSGMSGGTVVNRVPEVNRVIKGVRPAITSVNCSSKFTYEGGRCNAVGLSEAGRELAKIMAAHGALVDADHLSYKARRQLLDPEGILHGWYPLVSSHSGAASINNGNAANEGQLANEDIDAIIRAGGAFAPRLPPVTATGDEDTFPTNATIAKHGCGGTTESFVQVYRFFLDKFQKVRPNTTRPFVPGLGIGTDFGPPIPVFSAPRFYVPGQVVGDFDLPMLIVGFAGSFGRCYNFRDPLQMQPMVQYPFSSPLAPNMPFDKSTTPWDGRTSPPGYDISVDGVPHVGMIPDFVEEMRVLGLSQEELQPLWHGAEAYIRAWEAAEAWQADFDSEGKAGIRANCETDRAQYLESWFIPTNTNTDIGVAGLPTDVSKAVTALKGLRASHCRGTPE